MRQLIPVVLMALAAPLGAQGGDIVERHRRAEAERHYQAGETALRGEDYDEAVLEFRRAIEIDPQLVLARYGLGQAYMALKRFPEAVETYAQCRDLFHARAALSQREKDRLERDRRDQIREIKEIIRGLRQQANRRNQPEPLQIIRMEEHIRVLESAELKGADQSLQVPAWLSLALGSAYLRQGLLPDAEREYKESLQVDNKMGAAHNNLAWIYMQTGRYDEAEKALREAEKCGFPVSPQFKQDVERLKRAAQDAAGGKS